MASGQKRVVLNTRERLVSNDFNRLQDFVAASRAELMRSLFNDVVGNFYSRPGINRRRSTNPTNEPLPADVYSGLEVIVDDASNLYIEPGAMMAFIDPPASSDDSPYVIALDTDGMSTPGILTFLANAGPGVRIDVVECQPSAVVLETDSRDIYNETTGLFTGSTVDKVRVSEIVYRIRRGSAGAGPPGYDPDWLPLAVCIVQQGAADFTEVDFYDVRPLVTERSPVPTENKFVTAANEIASILDDSEGRCEDSTDFNLYGNFRGSFGGYLMGGDIRRNTASTLANFGVATGPDGGDAPFLALASAENQKPALTVGSYQVFHIAAAFPSLEPSNPYYSLPRWVRYSQTALAGTPARRRPVGPRGILVVTNDQPYANGVFSGILLPSQMGWTFIVPARSVMASHGDSSGGFDRFMVGNGMCHPGAGYFRSFDLANADYTQWNLNSITDIPPNAKTVLVALSVTKAGGTPGNIVRFPLEITSASDALLGAADSALGSVARFAFDQEIDSFGQAAVQITGEVPVGPPDSKGDGSFKSTTIQLSHPFTGLTTTGALMSVLGYRLR